MQNYPACKELKIAEIEKQKKTKQVYPVPFHPAADDILNFFFFLWKKINLDISYESSAWQMIYMKCQDFSLKNNLKNRNVVCCKWYPVPLTLKVPMTADDILNFFFFFQRK